MSTAKKLFKRATLFLDLIDDDLPLKILHASPKCRNADRRFRIVGGQIHEHADAPHPLTLLRAHGKRPSPCRPNRVMKSRRLMAPVPPENHIRA
jgi:hypothetical protein